MGHGPTAARGWHIAVSCHGLMRDRCIVLARAALAASAVPRARGFRWNRQNRISLIAGGPGIGATPRIGGGEHEKKNLDGTGSTRLRFVISALLGHRLRGTDPRHRQAKADRRRDCTRRHGYLFSPLCRSKHKYAQSTFLTFFLTGFGASTFAESVSAS